MSDAERREIEQLRQQLAELENSHLTRQTALSNVIRNIRATLNLDRIFETTAREVRHLLKADRVGVFRFFPHTGYNDGEFISEDVAPGYNSALEAKVRDRCFGEQFAIDYHRGRIQAVADIHDAGLSDCHVEILGRFQVRANLVVPLMKSGELWGLLCVHQCDRPRDWTTVDIEFVREVALHLDIAIQQAELVERTRQQAQRDIERIAENTPGAMYQLRLDLNGELSFPYLSPSSEQFLELSSDRIQQQARFFFDAIHPQDRQQLETSLHESAQNLTPWHWSGRLQTPSGQRKWIEGRSHPELQADGAVVWFGWFIDISDRKIAESERQNLVSIVENSTDFIGIGALDGRPIYLNAAGQELLGISGDVPLQNYTVADFFLPEDYPWIEANIFKQVRETGSWRGEVNFRHFQTGEAIPVDYNVFTLLDPETQECLGLATVTRDMRDRKAAEQALRESEQRFRDVSEAAGEYLWEINAEGIYTFLTERVRAVKGHGRETLLGRNLFEFIDNRDSDRTQEILQAAREAKQAFQLEHRSLTADGEVVWEAISGLPLLNDDGQLLGFRGAGMSITERKRAEEDLKRTLADLNAVLDNLAEGLLIVNTQGRIVRFNPVLQQMFALSGERLRDRTCEECGLTALVDPIARVRGDDNRQVLTAEVPLAEGRIGQALTTNVFEAVEDADCEEETWIGTAILIRDVTAEKEVDRMKTDFISTVSHELRTPLTSVLGFASIVLEKLEEKVFPAIPSGDRKQQKHIDRVRRNLEIIVAEAERLTVLIDDVLDIAKMEAGKVEWKAESLSMAEVLERGIAATSALVERQNLTLTCNVEPNLPQIVGDRDRLIQVVINLLSNAVKFTEDGGLTCRLYRRDDEIRVEIADTGMGIAPEDLPKVFDKFQQVGETLTDKPKGTGLGLPICQQIVEHHGGRIWAESQLGAGSTFIFTLPLTQTALDSETEPMRTLDMTPLVEELRDRVEAVVEAQTTPSQKTILVVDDDKNVRELLRQSLQAQGYNVQQAKDGVEAIVQVKRSRPDLIVLDVMMPYIDGFDVAAVLKNEPQTMGIPILVLSIVEDRERGYRVGIDRYLKKPIDRQGLLSEVGTLLAQGQSRKKVLVVDRDTSTLHVLSDILTDRGYSVVQASSDRECVDKAIAMQPDIIAINSDFLQRYDRVRALRFEKGLENVVFVLLGEA